MSNLLNGKPWLDTDGNVIHAHGGHMLYHEGWYYWYGENRLDNNYVACYRSKDLKTFEFRENIITTETPTAPYRVLADLTLARKAEDGSIRKVNLERPKVLYCAYTKKFVLWAHYENGENYNDARCAVATSDYPDHGFTYHGSFNPFGSMARDCTLFLDDDGRAYFIAASRNNADLHIWRLSKDFMNTDKLVNVLWQGEYREAPALFKKDGRYYMLSSWCTGWNPNQGKWSSAQTIDGEWEILREFGDALTFRSQPAFVLPVVRDGKEKFLYVGDRWEGNVPKYFDSTYIVLEIKWNENNEPYIEYSDEAAF
ncbi:MAG: hypothetical protein E7632_01600 [Ruminococcaceae bacterium]|nr:hypothetical protein [Oscillospiraceae bacterium]